jgi:predicted nicotinamide N-methyase
MAYKKRCELEKKLRTILPGASLKEIVLPNAGDIQLFLLDENYHYANLSNEEIKRLIEEPFFWPFCWPAGQILARWLFDHKDRVKGKKVLDFGSGSGVVAIASALSGAKEVWALDSDPVACEAIEANAMLNSVLIHVENKIEELEGEYDLIFVADVLYDHNNISSIWELLKRGKQIIIADSWLDALPEPFVKIGEGKEKTIPELGDRGEWRKVSIFIYP